MGDRISIQFVKEEQLSVVLCSHWRGKDFLKDVKKYLKGLGKTETKLYPLDRREPQTIMVDFVRYLTKDLQRVDSDLYFGFNKNDVDNSDNGHFYIDLKTGKILEEHEFIARVL